MKKIISITLAVCICLSLIGGVSFAAATEALSVFNGSFTYDFVPGTGNCPLEMKDKSLWGYTDDTYASLPYCFFDADEIIKGFIECSEAYIAENGTIPVYNSTDNTPPEDAAKYTFEYAKNTGSVVLGDFYTRLLYFNGNKYFRFRTATSCGATDFPEDRWVALKLDASRIPGGIYDVTFNSFDTYIRRCSIYLATYDETVTNTEEYMTEDNLLFTQSSPVAQKKVENLTLTSDADDYVLIIKLDGVSEVRLTSVTFDHKMSYTKEHSKDEPVVYKFDTSTLDMESLKKAGIVTDDGATQYIAKNDLSTYVGWDTFYGRNGIMDTTVTAPWKIDSEYSSTLHSQNRLYSSYLRFDLQNKNHDKGFTGDASTTRPYFVIRTYVPNPGTFDVKLAGKTHGSGQKTDVYIAKVPSDKETAYSASDIATLFSSAAADYMFTYDTSTGTAQEKQSVSIEAGENIWIFVTNDESQGDTTGRTYISSLTLTPADDAEYAEAFGEDDLEETTYDPDVYAYAYAKDNSAVGATVKATENGDGSGKYTLTAPEYAGDNNEYKFLYWAKGLTTGTNRQVVSTSATYTDYVPQNGKNYVIAVYDKAGESAKAEFYNANGQLITTLTENGSAPALPYMAGYGQAKNWALHGTSEKISGEAPVTVSGNMIFFAEYDTANPDEFEITVDGEKDTYTYGQKVECSAPAADADGGVFFGWKKTVNGVEQLVSTDNNYTFYAWEACTVTPVYKERAALFDGEKRRIILGTFTLGDKQAVMAEFFGFDDADEKGIILGTTDGTAQEIAMTSDNNQFTVVNDEDKPSISGYAILGGVKYIYNK